MVPRVVPMSGGGSIGCLFSGDDVATLAAQSGVQLKPEVDLVTIAAHLHNAFDFSLSHYAIGESKSAPAERREWFSELQSGAEALLKTLGNEPSADVLRLFHSRNLISQQNLISAFFDSDLYQKPTALPHKVRKLVNQRTLKAELDLRKRDAKIAGTAVDPLAELQTFQRVAVLPLLELAPWMIALLADLGRTGAARHSEQVGKATKPKDSLRGALFFYLAGAYEAMTGILPNVWTGRRHDPGLPAVKWFQAVLAKASTRVDEVFTLDNLTPSAAILPLSNKTPATIAKYIVQGSSAWKQKKPYATRNLHEISANSV